MNDLKILLENVRDIIQKSREAANKNGEKFNVFSILKMERKENATHSAFIGELLNPKGSHQQGKVFLAKFLEIIKSDTLDINTTSLKLEKTIGERNDKTKTGGRIDIYLFDKKGNTVSIENKIDAGDQNSQIERYCNHNKDRNTVFYLTLNGNEPTKESKGELKANEDYFVISYKGHIIKWLQDCLELELKPILKETIRQYLVLIKKLTFTMDTTYQEELYKEILNHFDTASYISANFKKALAKIAEDVRQKVIKELNKRLQDGYNIHSGSSAEIKNSQIWVKIKGKEEEKLFFGIQSFGVEKNEFHDSLFFGVFVYKGAYVPQYDDVFENKISNYWTEIMALDDFDSQKVNFVDLNFLKKLHTDSEFKTEIINHICNEFVKYINTNKEKVNSFLQDRN